MQNLGVDAEDLQPKNLLWFQIIYFTYVIIAFIFLAVPQAINGMKAYMRHQLIISGNIPTTLLLIKTPHPLHLQDNETGKPCLCNRGGLKNSRI